MLPGMLNPPPPGAGVKFSPLLREIHAPPLSPPLGFHDFNSNPDGTADANDNSMRPAASPPASWTHKLVPWLAVLATLACLLALLPPLPRPRRAAQRISTVNSLSHVSSPWIICPPATNSAAGCLPLLTATNSLP
jgi:hypothetical protein